MKVVVTGATGFLGGHIARNFRDVGWEIIAFDVAPCMEGGIQFAQGDLTDGTSVDQAVVVSPFPTELTFGEPRPEDVPPAAVAAKLAEEVLGWRSEMPFERGLTELIDGLVDAG